MSVHQARDAYRVGESRSNYSSGKNLVAERERRCKTEAPPALGAGGAMFSLPKLWGTRVLHAFASSRCTRSFTRVPISRAARRNGFRCVHACELNARRRDHETWVTVEVRVVRETKSRASDERLDGLGR